MSERTTAIDQCVEHQWEPSVVTGYAYCTRCPATAAHHTPDPRREPIDVVDRIDALVNDSLQRP